MKKIKVTAGHYTYGQFWIKRYSNAGLDPDIPESSYVWTIWYRDTSTGEEINPACCATLSEAIAEIDHVWSDLVK